ncbi:MAG TPA: ketoacyl-ACP synthase III [Thermoanaerobaculia bacterium]|nr:ketoacyl-ACP synthase III [Thermoanaerobaculia bacterium]
MATTRIEGVRLAGIASAVPSSVLTTEDTTRAFGEEDSRRILKNTGVRTRRVTKNGMCASDLCVPAAERLLTGLGWARDSVDLLVLVTQGPDYALPSTSCVLQHRLGLSTDCAAFDVNLGCSGYVYGVSIAAGMMGRGIRRALLMAGDMSSRSAAPLDRSVWPLFGDAASVTALEADAGAAPMHFVLGTDGRGAPHLILPAGGARYRRTADSGVRTLRSDGNVRSDEDVYMNGLEVLTFTLNAVPPLLRAIRAESGWSNDDVDHFVFHQASVFMLKTLARSAALPMSKFVIGMEEYGNASSASIPLAICDKLREALSGAPKKLVLAGYGVGWSWGAVALSAGAMCIPEVIVVPDEKPAEPLGPLPAPEPAADGPG